MNRCIAEKNKFLNAYKRYHGNFGQYVEGALGEILGLIPVDNFECYQETPDNAVIFAMTGTDGCHYCMTEENSTISIYAVFPNMGHGRSVYLIGHSIDEVLSYALSIYGLFECVFDYEKDQFIQIVEEVGHENLSRFNDERFKSDLRDLSDVYSISKFSPSDVYCFLRYNCVANINKNGEKRKRVQRGALGKTPMHHPQLFLANTPFSQGRV